MRKLLSANFARLRKSRLFWLCMAAMLIYSVVYMLNGCRQATADVTEYSYCIDEYYFQFGLSIGLFCALFSSMFFGTEYSDGTLRSKIVAGHTRANIYLASALTTFAATLLMLVVWLVGALIAVPTLGFWKMGIPDLLLYLLISILFVAAFSAIFTFISMLSENKPVTVVVSILLFFALLLFTSMLHSALSQPEMISGVQITANGLEMSEPSPNPGYVSGIKRDIYDFLVDFLPAGQGGRLWLLEIAHPIRMLVSSTAITLLTTIAGIIAFKKKDVK